MRWIRLLLITTVLSLVPVTTAQDTAVQTIPVTSRGYSFRVAPDGKTAIVMEDAAIYGDEPVDGNQYAKLIDLSTGTSTPLIGPTDFARRAAYTADSQQVATCHGNGDIFIWNTADGTLAKRINTLLPGTNEVEFMQDGKTLLMLQNGGVGHFLLLDTVTGAITRIIGRHFDRLSDLTGRDFKQSAEVLYSAFAVSPDEQVLVTANARGGVVMWDVATVEETMLVATPEDDPGNFAIRSMTFLPDGRLAYFDLTSNMMHLWDLSTKTETTSAAGNVIFAISPDGRQVVWADRATSDIYLAPLEDPAAEPVRLVDAPDGYHAIPSLTAIQFTPDGKTVIAGGFATVKGNTPIYVIAL